MHLAIAISSSTVYVVLSGFVWVVSSVFAAVDFDDMRIWMLATLDLSDDVPARDVLSSPNIVVLIAPTRPVVFAFDLGHVVPLKSVLDFNFCRERSLDISTYAASSVPNLRSSMSSLKSKSI